jgi:hypothetical protein
VGTEDYVGGSHYFARGPYAGPSAGCTLKDPAVGRFAGYRLHIPDAIPIKEEIAVELNHGDPLNSGPLTWNGREIYSGQATYLSVAYWYQLEPHDIAAYQWHTAAERRASCRSRLPTEKRDPQRPLSNRRARNEDAEQTRRHLAARWGSRRRQPPMPPLRHARQPAQSRGQGRFESMMGAVAIPGWRELPYERAPRNAPRHGDAPPTASGMPVDDEDSV